MERAFARARDWLDTVGDRPIPARRTAAELAATLAGPLPATGSAAPEVVDALADLADPGLMAIGSGRFYGWVMGGTLPAALAADWLVSTWDQNAGMRAATPAVATLEEAAGRWIVALLGLPAGSDVGFVTGATMANVGGLAAGRWAVLDRVGWDVNEKGLTGAPAVRVLVGAERHDTVDVAARYLGLGRPTVVAADDQGRIRPEALAAALAEIPGGTPLIVVLQAGNLHSGAFDPFADVVASAHRAGAWVHVDGAFGLWAGADPAHAYLTAAVAGADSWATDAHKTLNVPYDCGIVVVADRRSLRAAFGVQAAYLLNDSSGPGDPLAFVPELSRRARGVPVWAALRSLGSDGVADLVARLCAHASWLAVALGQLDGIEVLNDVCFTQVCVTAVDDAATMALAARLTAGGVVQVSGSRWRGRAVVRFSLSNWSTDTDDLVRTVDEVRRCLRAD
ncbi:MAG: aminotransferase class V-fold PLP-dependent enzyme [Nakamurella sp.]